MVANNKIKTYDTKTFTGAFMPGYDLKGMFQDHYTRFLVVPVEEMYRHVHSAIPPSRSAAHILIYITEGEGVMKVGAETYTLYKDDILVVAAGQVFSFEEYTDSVFNKGFICVFHEDIFVGKLFKPKICKDFEFLQVWGQP